MNQEGTQAFDSQFQPLPATTKTISVVVPVYQGGEYLERVLSALCGSELPRESWELIVVDDASTDGSASIAAAKADLVIRLTGRPRGPAYARNRGFEASRGSLVAFVDADVLVDPLALPRMRDAIAEDNAIGAIVGTYDAGQRSGGVVSEYRNLLRHFEHLNNAGDTDAFAAGLALVRRAAFANAGMFDEWHFTRPQAEALELGNRFRSLGYRIVRRPDVLATHLKRWTLRNWLHGDVLDRGMSVARLEEFQALRDRSDRLYLSNSIDMSLAWAALSMSVVAAWLHSAPFAAVAAVSVSAVLMRNLRLFGSFVRARGILFAAAALPLHVVSCAAHGVASTVGRVIYHAVGETQPDPVVQAFAEVGARTWPPIPAPRSTSRADGAPSQPKSAGSGV